MKMKLGEIFQAMSAWRALASVKMEPKMAYKVLKYVRLVSAEYEIVEGQRVALIHEITDTEPGQEAKIEPGSPEIADYAKRLNEVLVLESDLAKFDGSLDDIMAVVRDSDDNLLSVSDLATLEGFFKKPCVPEPPAVAGKVGPRPPTAPQTDQAGWPLRGLDSGREESDSECNECTQYGKRACAECDEAKELAEEEDDRLPYLASEPVEQPQD